MTTLLDWPEDDRAECCRDNCDACGQPACVDCDDAAFRCPHGLLLHGDECRDYCSDCGREDARDWAFR